LLRLKTVITRRLFTIVVLGSTQTLAWASSAFALLHGSGNGIITIARGGVLLVSSALSVSACLALCLLRARRAAHAD
jgi:hypothetical protein